MILNFRRLTLVMIIANWRNRITIILNHIFTRNSRQILLVIMPLLLNNIFHNISPSVRRRPNRLFTALVWTWGKTINQICLKLVSLLIGNLVLLRLPIKVRCNVSPILHAILEIFDGRLLSISKTLRENFAWTLVKAIIIRSETTIVLQHIWVTTWSITHVVKCGSIFVWRRRFSYGDVRIVFGELFACVSHNSIDSCETAIVEGDLLISTTSITIIADVLWFKCSLHGSHSSIGLTLTRMIHI